MGNRSAQNKEKREMDPRAIGAMVVLIVILILILRSAEVHFLRRRWFGEGVTTWKGLESWFSDSTNALTAYIDIVTSSGGYLLGRLVTPDETERDSRRSATHEKLARELATLTKFTYPLGTVYDWATTARQTSTCQNVNVMLATLRRIDAIVSDFAILLPEGMARDLTSRRKRLLECFSGFNSHLRVWKKWASETPSDTFTLLGGE